MEKLRLHWATLGSDQVGNALGYATHTKQMYKHSKPYIEDTENASIALHITPADKFTPIPGKFNVLFTMWEMLDVPPSYRKAFSQADALIVPSSFCKKLFRKYTNKPIEVCWEGVDPEKYPYSERENPLHDGRTFRWLWVGAPNPRKGYQYILEAVKLVEQHPQMEMYVKTTMPQLNWWGSLMSVLKNYRSIFKNIDARHQFMTSLKRSIRRIPKPSLAKKKTVMGKHKNIIFDARFIPFEELQQLYANSHAFLFPTLGEGWGLTLCEAMATGLPSIAPIYTGHADFATEDLVYPVAYQEREQTLRNYDNLKTRGYMPDKRDFLKKMIYVFKNYDRALRRGKKASNRIHKKFTWDHSGKRLASILNDWSDDYIDWDMMKADKTEAVPAGV